MSLAELEKQVRQLPPAERAQFVWWVRSHEDELIDPPQDDAIAPEVMEELLRRRAELEEGSVPTFTIEEMSARVRESLDEVHRSRH